MRAGRAFAADPSHEGKRMRKGGRVVHARDNGRGSQREKTFCVSNKSEVPSLFLGSRREKKRWLDLMCREREKYTPGSATLGRPYKLYLSGTCSTIDYGLPQ